MSLNPYFHYSTWMETPENVFEVASILEFLGNFPTHVYVFEMLSVREFPGTFPTDVKKNMKKKV